MLLEMTRAGEGARGHMASSFLTLPWPGPGKKQSWVPLLLENWPTPYHGSRCANPAEATLSLGRGELSLPLRLPAWSTCGSGI